MPKDTHIFRMTDSCGMLQHTRYGVPDPSTGYTVDDNARALIMAILLFEATQKQEYLNLVVRYLGFLMHAQNGAWFRNFMDYDRCFTEEKGSPDSFGRCIWALGFAASCSCLPAAIRDAAISLLKQTVTGCDELISLRAKAYALIGLSYWQDQETSGRKRKLAAGLAQTYHHAAETGWKWFEESITYCNAVLPWAMLMAPETKEDNYRNIGLESLDFLLGVTLDGEFFHPVGCNGWLLKGKKTAKSDEQPVEACETLLACLKAYELTGNEIYRNCARRCLAWYTGQNSLGVSLIDPDTGGCMDGIMSGGVNRNQGAESIVSWMIASLAWQEHAKAENSFPDDV